MLWTIPIEHIPKSANQKSVVPRTRASRTTCHSWCWGHRKLVDEHIKCGKTEGKRWWKLCRILQIDMIETGKKTHVRLYDWDYVEKNPMFFQFFRIKLWDFSIGIKAKDADGETVEGHGNFSWWFYHGHSSHNMKILAEIVLFFYQLSHKITQILVLFWCPIIWKCLKQIMSSPKSTPNNMLILIGMTTKNTKT